MFIVTIINHMQSTDMSCPNWGIDNVACCDETVLKREEKPDRFSWHRNTGILIVVIEPVPNSP